MLVKMRKHAGPWYVLEHLRPFPGVTLERILLQVRRGLITPTSIVRGPSTDHQWRFAVETPGICRLFGRCWNCYHGVRQSETYCPACLSHLGFEKPAPKTVSTNAASAPPKAMQPAGATAPSSLTQTATTIAQPNLNALASAARMARNSNRPTLDGTATVGPIRAGWIAVAAIAIVLSSLVWVTTLRSGESKHSSANQPPAPSIQTPATSE